MRLFDGFKEIFYFPFYFVSLNVAGFFSFVRFIRGTQPPMWKKSERLHRNLKNSANNCPIDEHFYAKHYYPCYPFLDLKGEKNQKADELNIPKASSG